MGWVHAKVAQRELAYIEAKPLVGHFFEPKIIHIQCACGFQVQCHSKLLVGVGHCFAWQVTHPSRLMQSTSALTDDPDPYPQVFQFQNAIISLCGFWPPGGLKPQVKNLWVLKYSY